MNKKIVTMILTLTLCTTFIPTTVEAKLVNIMTPGKETTTNTVHTADGIKVIKKLGITVDSTTMIGQSSTNGDYTQGVQGLSVAFAYLTPTKQFGIISRTNIDILDKIKNEEHSSAHDELHVWSKSKTVTESIRDFYNNAVKDFLGNGSIKSELENVTAKDIKSNAVLTQVSDANREFIASTLYVRWFYDLKSGRTDTSDMYMKQLPVLEFYGGNSGPYVAWGDFFSSTMKMIPSSKKTPAVLKENENRRKNIAANADKYVRGLNAITGKHYAGTHLTSDPYYGGKTTQQTTTPNSKALFEKSYEFRRYFKRGSSETDYYEIVYPVTHYTTITNKSNAPKGLDASIKSNTIFTDNTKTEVEKYVFNVSIKPFEPETNGIKALSSPKTYTILHNKNSTTIPSSPSTEPPENKADVWHDIISRKLTIKTKRGTLVKSINLASDNETVTVYPQDVNYENLGGYIVSVEVKYKTLSRYMQQKEVYTYSYNWDDGDGNVTNYNYSALQQELTKKGSSLIQGALNQIQEYNNKLKPQSIYKFVTAGLNDAPQTKIASDVIAGPHGKDPAEIELNVEVNPPNALTVLEGGVFDIILSFDTNDIPIGKTSPGARVWIEDLKVTPIIVTAQNGDIIYEHTTPITDITNDKLSATIVGVTAKPSHIGKATVVAHYTYTLIEEVYAYKNVYDEFGNVISTEEYLVRRDETPSKGTGKGYFNIYSLTGVTS